MLLAPPAPLADEAATRALAARLAPRLAPGDTVLLGGGLGAGKTAFARALIRARLGDPSAEVPSPTFTLVQTYGEGDAAIWHADLYRLSRPHDVAELGLLDAMGAAICLIEWPDRLGPLAPQGALTLDLAPHGADAPDSRVATFSGPPAWAQRLDGLLG